MRSIVLLSLTLFLASDWTPARASIQAECGLAAAAGTQLSSDHTGSPAAEASGRTTKVAQNREPSSCCNAQVKTCCN